MKWIAGMFIAVTVVAAAMTFFSHSVNADTQEASVVLKNAAGQDVGTVSFLEFAIHGTVLVKVQARNLPPGTHGMHIHTVGQCVAPAFTSAGSHFNPLTRAHGLLTSAGSHAGDLPNLIVDASGNGSFEMVITDRFTVHAGPTSILDADGSALVIHANVDDGVTDPTGNSGDRIACGVVTAGPASPLVAPTVTTALTAPRTGDGGLVMGENGISLLPILALVVFGIGGAGMFSLRKRASGNY